MAIKAGRVGVAPNQVDEFGNISSEATSGYTKQEADAKFETQTHAASTYETKSDAAALQPIQLSVPIELLYGSELTVENALKGISDFNDITSDVEVVGVNVDSTYHKIEYNGLYLQGVLSFHTPADVANNRAVFRLPADLRVFSDNTIIGIANEFASGDTVGIMTVDSNGYIRLAGNTWKADKQAICCFRINK